MGTREDSIRRKRILIMVWVAGIVGSLLCTFALLNTHRWENSAVWFGGQTYPITESDELREYEGHGMRGDNKD